MKGVDHAKAAPWALLLVQLLFGLFPVAAKRILQPADPLEPGGPLNPASLLAMRVGGAAICLVLLHAWLVRNPVPVRQMPGRLAILALTGIIVNMGLFMVGLQLTTATEAVLVITSIPVFTYALAVLMGRETIGPYRIAGILLAIGGVVTLVGFRLEHALGNLLVLGNSLSYAAFLVLARPTIQKYDSLSLTTWLFAIGALVFVPIGLASGLNRQAAQLDAVGWGWMAFIILGATLLTYVLNNLMLRHVASSTVAAFTYVQPVFTAVAAFFILGEKPSGAILPAAVLIFVGVWLVARRKPKALEGVVAAE